MIDCSCVHLNTKQLDRLGGHCITLQCTVLRTVKNPEMKSQSKSLRLPADLAEAAEVRASQLGYRSWTDYLKGLMRYDLMVHGSHFVTLPISLESLHKQDHLDAELLENCKKGVGVRGEFLKRVLEEVVGPEKAEELAKAMVKAITEPKKPKAPEA